MKKLIAALLALMLLAGMFAAGEEDLQSKYSALVSETLRTLCRVGTEELNKWGSGNYVIRDSAAWNTLIRYDSGWFGKLSRSEFKDFVSDNYVRTGEKNFECDVWGTYKVIYQSRKLTREFTLGYHLVFENISKNAKKEEYKLKSFSNLPVEAEAETARVRSEDDEGVEVSCITGPSYRGYVVMIEDPARVSVGVIDTIGSGDGWRIDQISNKYNALIAINGGAFSDSSKNKSNSGKAEGYVVSEGTAKNGNNPRADYCKIVMGFDADNILHVGTFTNDQLKKMQLRDALSFNQAFVQDGKRVNQPKNSSYSARTGIGQDAEGRVYFVVIQGRQPDSLGACFDDMADIFVSLGCVNAGNLDGGNSTALFMNGESVYSAYQGETSRKIPTAFIVR